MNPQVGQRYNSEMRYSLFLLVALVALSSFAGSIVGGYFAVVPTGADGSFATTSALSSMIRTLADGTWTESPLMRGAIAGSVLGAAVGGLLSVGILAFVPLLKLNNRFYVMAGVEMTGHEHNRMQVYGRTTLLKILCLQMIVAAGVMLVTGKFSWMPSLAFFGSLILLPVTALCLRQRCPFCRCRLTLDFRKVYFGERCRDCGQSFCDTVATATVVNTSGGEFARLCP